MVTSVNKMNNHLSPQTLNTEKTTAYDIGNPDSCLEQAHKCGGVKLVNEIAFISYNWILDENSDIKKTITPA